MPKYTEEKRAAKKDAKKRVRSVDNPLDGTNLSNPIAKRAYIIFEASKIGAELLIDIDPYNLFEPKAGDAQTPRSPLSPWISPDDALANYRESLRQTTASNRRAAVATQDPFDDDMGRINDTMETTYAVYFTLYPYANRDSQWPTWN